MFAVRITGGMVDEFEEGQLVPVFDEPPPDADDVIRSEADFDIAALARDLRQWRKGGGSEDDFRETLREAWPLYADVAFPDRRGWLLQEHAQALVELGVAETVEMGSIEDALEAWGL